MANIKISELPIGTPNVTSIFPFVDNGTTYQGAISAITSSVSVTYSELVDKINGETLTIGTYYIITDFQTCYDVPEYYVNGNAKGNGNVDYRQGGVDPIIVLATSVNTISSTAYQPSYPNDRIQYDWTWNATEITGGDAYGRIFERIDEYNNRTDYDHRVISFNRFQSYNLGAKLSGTLTNYNSGTGVVVGTGTLFLTEVSNGDVLIYYSNGFIGFKVISATTNTQLTVVVDSSFGSSINFTGGLFDLFKSSSTGYYNDYKEVYVGQKNVGDWDDVLTFNLNGTTIHNYVGDYSKFYLQEVGSNSGFMLSNNVFNGNNIYSNIIGDRSYNNTGRYWFVRNTIAGRFYNNVIQHNGFYSNSIGEYFDNNIIKQSMYSNTIEQNFENNQVYSEFRDNKISNGFNGNKIYSQFYSNQIGLSFEDNTIGDIGNNNNFSFYRNRIGNDFYNNTIKQEFQNNQIGNQFNNNTTNGFFYKNVIGNGFNNNQNIGYDFYGNHIGNAFNGNPLIADEFYDNQIGEYFESNTISTSFNSNQIGNSFQNNSLGNTQYFNWDDTSIGNLTSRTYGTFRQSVNNNVGNYILGTLLIMHDTVNDEYHKVKFTQWTQGSAGGGFSYERTKVYPTTEPTVYFTKPNYSNVVDVIVPGVLEIKRGNNQGIFNVAEEGSWNSSVSPYGTEWNSIYTESNNGNQFRNNKIGNDFGSNNNIGNSFYNNVIGNNFYNNDNIGNNFQYNDIKNDFQNNTIGNGFQTNQIGNYFNNNTIGDNFGYGYNYPQGNKIGNNFYDNTIGEYFYNNTTIDNFISNTVSNYFQLNIINSPVSSTTLTSCVLYSGLTVNVFKNGNGDDRLSYYDESDVLTIESLTESGCTSFTLSSTDFTDWGDGAGVTPNGTLGFTTDGLYDAGTSVYNAYNFVGNKGTIINAFFNGNGLLTNGTGYIFDVTWGVGSSISSGKVLMGFYGTGFHISPINTGNNNWQTPGQGNYNIESIAGTFNFTATFTLYSPTTEQNNSWC